MTQASRKGATLLSYGREHTYRTLRAPVLAKTPADVEYEDIVRVLGHPFAPKPSALLRGCRFHKRYQLPTESAPQHVESLVTTATWA